MHPSENIKLMAFFGITGSDHNNCVSFDSICDACKYRHIPGYACARWPITDVDIF